MLRFLCKKTLSRPGLLSRGLHCGLQRHRWCSSVIDVNAGLLFGNFAVLDRRKNTQDCPFLHAGGTREFCNYAAEQYSDDEYECEFENHKGSSSVANIDEWKWRLSLLLRNKEEQEIISKDKKDRRDYEQIAALARRMGLFSEQYGKVVVASKVPLPNYRPDLDDKRPQREVIIPLGLQRRVESLLQEYLDRSLLNGNQILNGGVHDARDKSSFNSNEDPFMDQTEDQTLDGTVIEKILQRRSWRLLNLQRSWQVVILKVAWESHSVSKQLMDNNVVG